MRKEWKKEESFGRAKLDLELDMTAAAAAETTTTTRTQEEGENIQTKWTEGDYIHQLARRRLHAHGLSNTGTYDY